MSRDDPPTAPGPRPVTGPGGNGGPVTRPRLALAAICVGFFLVLLDTTILNVALPRVGEDLGGSTSDLQWVVNAYTIAFAALLLSGGALSDRLGTLRVYCGGLIGFGVASLLCAIAPVLGLLIAGRALQGLAAAVMVPSSLSLIAHTFPAPRERATAVGIWVGASGIAASLGPIIGGVLVEYVDWRAVFLINLPVVVAGVWVGRRHIPPVPLAAGRALDLPGQALAVVVLVGLTGGLIESGEHAWGSVWVWGPLLIAVVALALLLVVEARHHDPVVPMDLFRGSAFAAGTVIGALINLAYYGQLFVLSLYFQDVLGYSPLQAGLAFLPAFAGTFFISWAAGRMTARWGPARPMVIGLGVGMTGLLLLLLAAGADTPYWALVPGLALLSAGALTPAPLSVAVIAAAPQDQSGMVSGLLNAARQTGGALGVAILGSLIAANAFIDGMRVALALSAAAYGVSIVLTLVFMRTRRTATPRTAVAEPART
ncbi:MFS transporter [Miltoncostaea oceani]|uniref:MFS transporter n=1 Tax=Miltoncostaea oceani TaxID=2843216 RepID=UPI001C3CDB8C|nr:MFS transporter [Miltoncostaea oceani]